MEEGKGVIGAADCDKQPSLTHVIITGNPNHSLHTFHRLLLLLLPPSCPPSSFAAPVADPLHNHVYRPPAQVSAVVASARAELSRLRPHLLPRGRLRQAQQDAAGEAAGGVWLFERGACWLVLLAISVSPLLIPVCVCSVCLCCHARCGRQ